MPATALHSLSEVFSQVPDPRSPRGIRHPFAGVLSLVFLGMLASRAVTMIRSDYGCWKTVIHSWPRQPQQLPERR